MQLERIEISGFRGIQRMALSFDALTILIGENAWGKSSLLDALALALQPTGEFYEFQRTDFHWDQTQGYINTREIQIILRWKESFSGEHRARRYRQFNQIWNFQDQAGLRYLDMHIQATYKDNKIISSHQFLDTDGNVLAVENGKHLFKQLMRLHPIIRIQDARRLRDHALPMDGNATRLEKRLENTVKRLQQNPGHVNQGEITSGLKAMRTLLDHYFAFDDHNRMPERRDLARQFNMRANYLHPLEAVAHNTSDQSHLVLMGLLSTFVRARGPKQLKANARPILIFEDPESRLHPTILNQAWRLIDLIPMQKIVTTNSGDLLSAVPLTCIRRLVRSASHTDMYAIRPGLLSRDQERRMKFHIRIHRPSALFARCWFFVEGETEVWLFNELAKLQGYDFASEGIHLIEFAQSGLKPLIKIAHALGIEWYVLVDGDLAGQKYAQTARQFLNNDHEKHRLTVLPEQDIEHFLYHNGYETLFRKMAHLNDEEEATLSITRIIARALRSFAKPDAALSIIAYSEAFPDAVPLLFKWAIQRVVTIARGSELKVSFFKYM